MSNSTKKTIWIVLLAAAIVLDIVAIGFSSLPMEIVQEDGSTALVYVTGTKEIICHVAAVVCLVGALIAGLSLRKSSKKKD